MGEDNAVLAVDTERQEENFYPVEVTQLKEFEFLRIVWDDGHLGDYPLAHLRSYCTCSTCGGRGDYSRFERKDSYVQNIYDTGNGALRVDWDNGNHTSIYSFTFLRSLCRCWMCEAERMLADSIERVEVSNQKFAGR